MHQRSYGALRLGFKRREHGTVLADLRQEGCLKARFPRSEPGAWAGAVTLNTSGGVAGGDRLGIAVRAGAGTRLSIASQAAERFYRAIPGSYAEVSNHLTVEPGAALEWLPQETILFDRCALRRRLRIDLAVEASFLGVESLVFGRAAMGETVGTAEIDDLVELRREGKLVLHDRIRLHGPVSALLDRRAVAAGARAAGTLIHVAPEAESRLDALRVALAPFDAGASFADGLLLARIVARDGAALRSAVVAGLNVLRDGRKLPRVWLC